MLENTRAGVDRDQLLGGLKPGESLPHFQAINERGETVSDIDLRGRSTVMVLIESGCEPCEDLAEAMRATPTWSEGVEAFVASDDSHSKLPFVSGLGASVLYEASVVPHN